MKNNFIFIFIFISSLVSFVHSTTTSPYELLGIHPLDERYYLTEVIQCKDGSKSFTKDRVNDDYCDCVDGTDEPGTSACARAKFYCRNLGSIPKFIFSSRVNDLICDCCDGSDEHDGKVDCPNTCVMGGNVKYRTRNFIPKISGAASDNDVKELKKGGHLEDLIQNIKGLKMVVILQLVFIKLLIFLFMVHRHLRSKRRRHHR
ncbi:hypothetical protein ACFE04_019243 [Oxalis oulophora]